MHEFRRAPSQRRSSDLGVDVLGVECAVARRAGLLERRNLVVDLSPLGKGENAEPPRRPHPRRRVCRAGVHRSHREGLVGVVVVLQGQGDVMQVIVALRTPCGFTRAFDRWQQQRHQHSGQEQQD